RTRRPSSFSPTWATTTCCSVAGMNSSASSRPPTVPIPLTSRQGWCFSAASTRRRTSCSMPRDHRWTCRSIPSSLVSLSCRERHMRIRFVIVSIALVWCAAAPAAAQSRVAWVRQSDIIFAGTVTRVAAGAGVVRVDHVLEKPDAVSLMKGDSVAVLAARAGSLNPGLQATFYTTGWIYGRWITVREVGHEAIGPQLATVAGAGAGGTAQQDLVARARQQVNDADLKARIQA